MNVTMEASSKTRLVRVRGGNARRLIERFPRAFKIFDSRYSPQWLIDHVINDRMELWDVRDRENSIGFVAAYVSRVSEKPSYFIWGLYMPPRQKGWQRPLLEWFKERARDLGCSHLEFVTPRGQSKVVNRYLKMFECEEWRAAYVGYLAEV